MQASTLQLLSQHHSYNGPSEQVSWPYLCTPDIVIFLSHCPGQELHVSEHSAGGRWCPMLCKHLLVSCWSRNTEQLVSGSSQASLVLTQARGPTLWKYLDVTMSATKVQDLWLLKSYSYSIKCFYLPPVIVIYRNSILKHLFILKWQPRLPSTQISYRSSKNQLLGQSHAEQSFQISLIRKTSRQTRRLRKHQNQLNEIYSFLSRALFMRFSWIRDHVAPFCINRYDCRVTFFKSKWSIVLTSLLPQSKLITTTLVHRHEASELL